MTWATSVPILVFLGFSVLDLGPMYATDRQTSDAHHLLMPPPYGGSVIISKQVSVTAASVSADTDVLHHCDLLQSNGRPIAVESYIPTDEPASHTLQHWTARAIGKTTVTTRSVGLTSPLLAVPLSDTTAPGDPVRIGEIGSN